VFEVLEPRILLNAAYEVWGGNTDYSDAPGGWWSAALNVDQLGDYTKLGEANGTATFNGSYTFYIVATRAQVPIDAVQGSDLNYLNYITNSGNTSDIESVYGSPDGYYAVVGTQYDQPTTFAGFLVLRNPDSWNQSFFTGGTPLTDETGITVITGTDLKPAVNVWIADTVNEQLPAGGPDQDWFSFEVQEPGLVDSARVHAPTEVWYDLQRDSSGQLQVRDNQFDTPAALQAVFPDGTYTLEMTSSVLGTFTTQFNFFGNQPVQVPVVTTPTFAQSDVPTDVTVQWDPCTDPYVTGIEVDISDNANSNVYHDWGLSPSATSSGPASLTAAQNYEVDVRFQNQYNGQNEDGYWYESVKETERELDIRTAGGESVLPDLYADTGNYTPGSYSPGDSFGFTIGGGNAGPGNAYAFDGQGNPIPFYIEVRLSRDLIWGNSDDVVLWQQAFGSMLGGGASGGGMDVSVTLPLEVSSGLYYLVGKLDATDVVVESNKVNNTLWSSSADISIPGPESFVLTSPTTAVVQAGDPVTIQWTAGNVPAGSTVSLCYDPDTIWANGNEHWLVINAAVSDGAGSYLWDTTGVASGTYYLAGNLYDGYGVFTISQLTGPGEHVTVTSVGQSFTLTAPAGVAATAGDLVSIQWTALGVVPGATISLCYDQDGIWMNGNEHWLTVDMPVSNGPGAFSWNTAGVVPGTYYVAGYMYDWNGTTTFSHMTAGEGITIRAPFAVTGPAGVTANPGDVLSVTWTASNVAPGTTVSLCYDEDGISMNGNEHWLTVDMPVSSGPGTFSWDTTGVAPGTYYVAGYMNDWNGTLTFSHMTAGQGVTVQPSFAVTGPGGVTVAPGDQVSVTWSAYNVVPGSTISLCYDEDTTWWNGNEHWITVDMPVSSGPGSLQWDTTDVPAGTYYLAGYMNDWNGNWTISQMSQSITVKPRFQILAPAPATVIPGDIVQIQYDAAGVVEGSTISLCYDEDTTWWNGNEHWLTVDMPVSNGPGTFSWNTAGVAPGPYYIAGYLNDGNGNWTISQVNQPVTFPFSISDTMPLTAGHHLYYSGQRDGAPVTEDRYVLAPQVINGVNNDRIAWTRTFGGVTQAEIEYVTANGLGYNLNDRLGTNASGDYSIVFSDPLVRAPDSPAVGQTYYDAASYIGQWLSGASAGFTWSGSVARWTTVLGFGRITVGAGTFRAAQLSVTETQTEWWNGGWQSVTSTSTMWIADSVGLVSQTSTYVTTDSNGGSSTSLRSRQLTSYV